MTFSGVPHSNYYVTSVAGHEVGTISSSDISNDKAAFAIDATG